MAYQTPWKLSHRKKCYWMHTEKETGRPWAYESFWKLLHNAMDRISQNSASRTNLWQCSCFWGIGYRCILILTQCWHCDWTWSWNDGVTFGFGEVVWLLLQGLSDSGLLRAKSAYWTLPFVWLLIKSRHFPKSCQSLFVRSSISVVRQEDMPNQYSRSNGTKSK